MKQINIIFWGVVGRMVGFRDQTEATWTNMNQHGAKSKSKGSQKQPKWSQKAARLRQKQKKTKKKKRCSEKVCPRMLSVDFRHGSGWLFGRKCHPKGAFFGNPENRKCHQNRPVEARSAPGPPKNGPRERLKKNMKNNESLIGN